MNEKYMSSKMGEKSSRFFAQVKIKKKWKFHHLDVPFVRIPIFNLEKLGVFRVVSSWDGPGAGHLEGVPQPANGGLAITMGCLDLSHCPQCKFDQSCTHTAAG